MIKYFNISVLIANPNILVTGGEGYIGSHLMHRLSSKQRVVVSIDNEKEKNQKTLQNGIFIKGDIADRKLVSHILKKYRIDVVMHLAGLINIKESMDNPGKYFDKNVVAGLKLLEAMRLNGVKKIMYSSSVAVYGLSVTKFIKETHQKNPINTYGLTKKIFEELLSYYHQVHGFEYVIFRYFNVAGADWKNGLRENHRPETHLIPLTLRALFSNTPIKIYGTDYNTPDGTCVRDYVHVIDIVKAHEKALPLLLQGKICDVFNLGSGKGHSVLEVLKECSKAANRNPIIQKAQRRKGDSPSLVADCKKIKNFLGWEPNYKLEDIIFDTKNSFYGKDKE